MFYVGQKVSFLNEEGGGEIVKLISDYTAIVKDEFDFERPYPLKELVVNNHQSMEDDYKLNEYAEVQAKDENKPKKRRLKKTHELWEVDLHIEELLESTFDMSNWEIIQFQMQEFERQLNAAIQNRVKRMVFIHGVGEGVLRSEIRNRLRLYENCEFFDASYKEYGFGATQVLIGKRK